MANGLQDAEPLVDLASIWFGPFRTEPYPSLHAGPSLALKKKRAELSVHRPLRVAVPVVRPFSLRNVMVPLLFVVVNFVIGLR
jgi:hypothetical protein